MDIQPDGFIKVLKEFSKVSGIVRLCVDRSGGALEAVNDENTKIIEGPVEVLCASTRPLKISFTNKYILKYMERVKKCRNIRLYFTTSSQFVYAEENQSDGIYEFVLMPAAPLCD
ncbi:hypothetical protein IX317_000621 [Fusobacterium sp. DD29]|uniref:hypothetical protein n=1 Tax=unclassified Fusobacterium TaxID=2648384 RepID=UPI001B8B2C0B|nr:MULTISPECIES: hypothetical protein [unclassified Fusobacterium]MBR8700257.1 hypothetical protein [Fusobacterium sp. DD45]MBR8710488.1 hypothetical protein [Fusobacterium sp. DD28]MBR8748960.1 hypothetical protein [Fusobacterium sp. DD29]MBR8751062.1 hypothetical protein [Fusobacterium sp. DD26]MBR8761266.1 hypothetical protein [Fusobacterium sp. DD25]